MRRHRSAAEPLAATSRSSKLVGSRRGRRGGRTFFNGEPRPLLVSALRVNRLGAAATALGCVSAALALMTEIRAPPAVPRSVRAVAAPPVVGLLGVWRRFCSLFACARYDRAAVSDARGATAGDQKRVPGA